MADQVSLEALTDAAENMTPSPCSSSAIPSVLLDKNSRHFSDQEELEAAQKVDGSYKGALMMTRKEDLSTRRGEMLAPQASRDLGWGKSASPNETERKNNFNVVIRVRPPLSRELESAQALQDGVGSHYCSVYQLSSSDSTSITLCDAVETSDGRNAVYAQQTFVFDRVFGEAASQEQVYEESARRVVLSVLNGYNGTLMAYGQTGTGKTYTMEGFTDEDEKGIIPRAVEDVFFFIEATQRAEEKKVVENAGNKGVWSRQSTEFIVSASFLQIYNEVLLDLLADPQEDSTAFGGAAARPFSLGGSQRSRKPLTIRHTPQNGVQVEGLSQWQVESEEDVYLLIERGTAMRATSATRMSELSSRSHAIFTLIVEAQTTTTTISNGVAAPSSSISQRIGKLNIVDLAGSEKVRHTAASGQRLEETKRINRSLHELGNVISALVKQQNQSTTSPSAARPSSSRGLSAANSGQQTHIPFRNSALTSVLRDSLGGNCMTTLIACISPSLDAYAESLSTLSFANRAKNVTNCAVANIGFSYAPTQGASGLHSLDVLQSGSLSIKPATSESTHFGDAQIAENASILLEQQRLKTEEGMKKLREALEKMTLERDEERERRLEAEEHLQQLQLENQARDRSLMKEDDDERASLQFQMERYKELLLKQRDIMLSLTTRLNERDEIIVYLEGELSRYETLAPELENLKRLHSSPVDPTPTPGALPFFPEFQTLLESRSASLAHGRAAAIAFPLQKRISSLLLERHHLRLRCESLIDALMAQIGGEGSVAATPLAGASPKMPLPDGATPLIDGQSPRRKSCSGFGTVLQKSLGGLEEVLQSSLKAFEEALEREHEERWRLAKRVEELKRRVDVVHHFCASAEPKNLATASSAASRAPKEVVSLESALASLEEHILTAVRTKEEENYEKEVLQRESAWKASENPDLGPCISSPQPNTGECIAIADFARTLREAEEDWKKLFEHQRWEIEQLKKLNEAKKIESTIKLNSVVAGAGSPVLDPRRELVEDNLPALVSKIEEYERDRVAITKILKEKVLRRVESVMRMKLPQPQEVFIEYQESPLAMPTEKLWNAMEEEIGSVSRILKSMISALEDQEESEESEGEAE